MEDEFACIICQKIWQKSKINNKKTKMWKKTCDRFFFEKKKLKKKLWKKNVWQKQGCGRKETGEIAGQGVNQPGVNHRLTSTWFVPLSLVCTSRFVSLPVCDHSQGIYFPPNRRRSIVFRVLFQQTNKSTNKQTYFPNNFCACVVYVSVLSMGWSMIRC